MIRIGHGYDVHALVQGRELILCGVKIPHELGLLGHSDADVALHALMDSMLGALALGDIGRHFPDADDSFKGADSAKLLERVVELCVKSGYTLGNTDITIIAQKPKLMPFIPQMVQRVSEICRVDSSRINVKATTEEGLGFTGECRGISAHVVCIMQKTV